MGTYTWTSLGSILIIFLNVFNPSMGYAGPSVLTYQGRIVRQSDKAPLEAPSVVFQFSIMSQDGTCTIFRETTGKDMSNSGGIFDIPVGEGTMSWPDAAHGGASFYVTNSFENNKSYSCLENPSGVPYSPGISDGRLLRVRFDDGSGLKTITPDNIIRSVPFAAESTNSAKLGGVLAANFVTKTTVPNCSGGSFLTYDSGTNTFGCASVGTILGTNISGNISGKSAGFTGNLVGDVSGDQSHTAVDKIKGVPVAATAPNTGEVLQYNGTSWAPAAIGGGSVTSVTGTAPVVSTGGTTPVISMHVADGSHDGYLSSTDWTNFSGKVSKSALATCTNHQTLSYNSVSDSSTCITIDDNTKLPLAGGTMTGAINMSGQNVLATGHITMSPQKTLNLGTYDNSSESTLVGSLGAADKGKIWYNTQVAQMKYWDGSSAQPLGVAGSGLTSLNGETGSTQTFATSTTGTDFTITHATNVQTFNLPTASSSARGLLSSADWTTFNSKLGAATNFAGDVSGTYSATSVDKIKGKAVTLTAPSSGQVLQYNGTDFVNATITDTFATLPCADGFVPYHASGTWSCVQASSTGALANTLMQLDGSKIATAAGYNISSGTASVTLVPPVSGVYSLTLPTTVGTSGQVLTSTGPGGVLNWTTPVTADATKLPLAGGTMTGDILMGGHLITGMKNVPNVASNPAVGQDGQSLRWNNTSGQWEWFSAGVAGAGITTFNGSTQNSQSFGALDLGTSVVTPAWSTNAGTGVHTLKIPMASNAGVTAGLLSKADYDSFNTKLGTATTFSGDVSGTYSATSVDKIQGKAVTLTAPSAGQVLQYNGTGFVNATVADATKLPLAGGTMTGDILMGGHLITGMKNVPNVAADPAVGQNGQSLRWNNTSGQWEWFTAGVAGAGITSFNGSTQGSQSFASIDLGTSVTAPAWSSNIGTGVHTLKIPMASDAGVTAGLLNKTDYDSFNSKLGAATTFAGDVSGTYSATSVDKIKGKAVTLTAPSSGQVLQYNGTGFVNATLTDSFAALPCADGFVPYHSSGSWTCVQASSTGALANTLMQLDGSKIATAAGYNISSGGAVVTLAPPVSGVYTLTLPTTAGTSGQVLTSTGASGILNWTTPSTTDATKLPLAGGTMTGDILMGGHLITGMKNVPNVASNPALGQDGQSLRWNNTSSQWEWFTAGVAGAGLTSFNGSSQNSQSFAAIDLGTSVTAPGWSTNAGTGVHTLKIPMASSAGVTAGLLSKSDYDSFNTKLGTATTFSGDVSGTYSATSVDKIQGKAVTLTTPSAGQVLQYNGTGFVNATVADATKLPLAGGTMTGDILMGGHLITGMKNVPNVAADPAVGQNGQSLRWNNTSGQWEWFTAGVAGAGMTTLNGSSQSTQSFGSIDLGTSVTAPAWSTNGATGVHTLKIPMASDTGVTAGLLSKADYTSIMSKQSNTLPDGQVWVGNGGTASAVNLSGDISSVTNTGVVTVVKSTTGTANQIVALDGSSVGSMTGLKLNGTSSVILTAASSPTANYTLRFPAAAPGANQVMQADALGNLTWVNAGSASAWVNGGNSFGAGSTIGTNDNTDLGIETNGTTRVTVKSGGNVGVGTATPNDTLEVNGTIRTVASVSNASTTIDWSKGNTQYTSAGCTGTQYTFSNMRDGGVYTLAITGTFSATCTFGQTSPDVLSGTPGSGAFYFLPANAIPSGSNSVYSFLRVGSKVYITWNSGFAN